MDNSKKVSFTPIIKEIVSRELHYQIPKKEYDKQAYPLIEFQGNFSINLYREEKIVAIVVIMKLSIKETEEEFMSLVEEFKYSIKEFDDVVIYSDKNGDEPKVHNDIIATLIQLSLSAMRGIISERLKLTNVPNEHFPIIGREFVNNIMNIKDKKEG